MNNQPNGVCIRALKQARKNHRKHRHLAGNREAVRTLTETIKDAQAKYHLRATAHFEALYQMQLKKRLAQQQAKIRGLV